MKYKAIVLDLDGTLTNNAKIITPKTKDALFRAQENGIRIILASGRPTYGISPIAEELAIGQYGGYVMAYNGACIIEWKNKNIIYNQTLNPEFVPELYAEARANGFEILTYQGNGIATTNPEDEYVQHEAFINKMPVTRYDDFANDIVHPINKCLIVGNPEPLAVFEKQLSSKLTGKLNVYRSADYFLECVPIGIDKAASLDHLIKQIHLRREEIVAVGDGYNDITMIEFAGLGVAMENASGEVKGKADFITLSNEDDGVAHVVELMLENAI